MSYFTIKTITLEPTGHPLYDDIKQSISQLYPIGLDRDTDEYKEHPKTKRFMEVFEKKALNYKEFYQPWVKFLKKLRLKSKLRIHDCSLTTHSCFTGELILDEYDDDAIRRVKKIIFSVSHIAQFFTVYGVDETFIKDKEKPWASGYHSINVITESPFSEFKGDFDYLEASITAQYPEYKFVPIRVSLHVVEGLQTPYSFTEQCTIHTAFFDTSFELNPVRFFRGEVYYGSGPSNVTVTLLPPPKS